MYNICSKLKIEKKLSEMVLLNLQETMFLIANSFRHSEIYFKLEIIISLRVRLTALESSYFKETIEK